MIKNFDKIKGQLRELAEVINSFKSEAVQVRLIELVLEAAESGSTKDSAGSEGGAGDRRRSGQRRSRSDGKALKLKEGAGAKTKSAGRPGGKTMLDRLYSEGFFKKPKTIKQLVEHCEHNLAFKYKQSDFSGPLGRFTRGGKLKRTKNADKQYEYSQA